MCLAVAMSSVAVSCSKSAIVPVNLRVESMQEPNCIDVAAPRLTWVDEPVSDKVCNESQSAYRIMVASSLKDLRSGKNLLWDTGKTESSCALRISYNGGKRPGLLVEGDGLGQQGKGLGLEPSGSLDDGDDGSGPMDRILDRGPLPGRRI